MHLRRTSIFVSSVFASSVFVLASIAAGCGSPVESVFDPDGGEWGERDGDGSVIVRDRDASRDRDGGGRGDAAKPNCDAGTSTASLQTCATATARASAEPLVMEFLLDGSASMTAYSGINKWAAAVDALNQVFDELARANDPNVHAGLIVFSDNLDCSRGYGPYPGAGGVDKNGKACAADVPPAPVTPAQLALLRARLLTRPGGGTPTKAALLGGYSTLRNHQAPPRARRVAVLVSDGVPTDADDAECVAEVANALSLDGMRTFSIGIGELAGTAAYDYDPAFMGDVAVAGGTRFSPSCDPTSKLPASLCHFQVTPSATGSSAQLTAEFTQALNVVRGRALGCEFALQASTATSAKLDPKKINVVWKDGAGTDHIVNKDPSNGWKYDNDSSPTKVIFSGQACTNVSNDPNSAISVVVGCASLEGECL